MAAAAKALAGDGGGFVTRKEMNEFAQSVNDALQGVGKIVNQNLSGIRQAFQFTDAHLHVSRRIINELAAGRARLMPRFKDEHTDVNDWYDEEGYRKEGYERLTEPKVAGATIDYDWYYREYNKMQHVVLFMQLLHMFVPPEKPVQTEQPVEPTDDFVFGGDHVPHQASP